jgi:hypothetical protein
LVFDKFRGGQLITDKRPLSTLVSEKLAGGAEATEDIWRRKLMKWAGSGEMRCGIVQYIS